MQAIVLVLVLMSGVPLICRLAAYDRGKHITRVAALHALLAIAVAWSGVRAWEGVADFGNLCTVLAAMAWLWISYHSWRDGVPQQFHKHRAAEPKPLDFTAVAQFWDRGQP